MIVHCLRYHEKRKTISLILLIKKQYALHISQKPCGHISLTMFDFVSRFWCNTVQILIFRKNEIAMTSIVIFFYFVTFKEAKRKICELMRIRMNGRTNVRCTVACKMSLYSAVQCIFIITIIFIRCFSFTLFIASCVDALCRYFSFSLRIYFWYQTENDPY